MSTLAHADSFDRRHRIFAALAARNRLVSVLRIAVPVLGLLVLGGLVLQLFIGSLAPGFSFASISVDRDRLVVDAPSYAAMSADGTSYAVTAATAATAPGSTDLVDLTGVLLTMRKPDGAEMTAAAEAAQLQTTDQLVRVPGIAHVADDGGTRGTLADVLADVPNETLTAAGPVDITFADGATLTAAGMTYAGDGTWSFTDATVVLPDLPGAAPAAPPPQEPQP